MMNPAMILINRLSDHPSSDELDVISQAEVFESSLDEMGINHERVSVDLNLVDLYNILLDHKPELIINLVESLNNDGSLVHVVPALLESMNMPFSGNSSFALFLTTHKPLAKNLMEKCGIPTPAWFQASNPGILDPSKRYIAKPSGEDASVGIADENVFSGEHHEILEKLSQRWGNRFFVEEFIEGREFNLSILVGKNGPEVLAPAEILFEGFPPEKPTIVGYKAKWEENSFEYSHTVRTFKIGHTDQQIFSKLKQICQLCWQTFNLRGYARIDFRVDKLGQPYVLEINANPCISPDSGFYHACLESGYTITEVINRIVEDI